jgi:hypothetical protein
MFKVSKTKIKTIKRDDRMFYIKGHITMTPRAGFEISKQCPREYGLILTECIDRGWLQPVAYMRDDEYAWESLKE